MTIQIDESMMGSEWTHEDSLGAFAAALQQVTGHRVDIVSSGDACDVSEDEWNRALDLYTAARG